MPKRRRFKQTESLQDRLTALAKDARAEAAELPPGTERDDLLRKARQADSRYRIAYQRMGQLFRIATADMKVGPPQPCNRNGPVPTTSNCPRGHSRRAIQFVYSFVLWDVPPVDALTHCPRGQLVDGQCPR
jgi:hypothetical protein